MIIIYHILNKTIIFNFILFFYIVIDDYILIYIIYNHIINIKDIITQ
jgi:hypothetical protein